MNHLHVHFESDKDTANGNFKDMLLSFAACGAKKVAVTDHGVFSAYEDVADEKKKLQEAHLDEDMQKNLKELDLIPGVEGYFAMARGEPTSHILLIAKDDIGYQSLCKIITQSNLDYVTGKQKGTGKPVITLQNLKDYVAKGHLICTTACIAGVFGTRFGLARMSLEEKLEEQVRKVQGQPLDTDFLLDKETLLSPAFKHLLSINLAGDEENPYLLRDLLRETPQTEAERIFYYYRVTLANWEIHEALRKEKPPKAPKGMQPSRAAVTAYEARKTAYDQCKDYQKKKPKKVLFSTLEKLLVQLKELPDEEAQLRECRQLYNQLIKIFGKRDFYFELQYHGLDSEQYLYRKLVDFATEVKNTSHFIASNDVHVGISKAYVGADAWKERLEQEVLKRDVISFTRFNKFMYDDDTIQPDAYEYYIKDEAELREWLSRILPETEILDNAFANLEKALNECHVEMADKDTHYPSFCEDADALFEQKVRGGITKQFPDGFPSEEYRERMEFELATIKQMGYSSYHLIVADYLEYGRLLGQLPTEIIQSERCPYTIEGVKALIEELHIEPNAYPIGPGRGSAVGSLCCYLLGITDIDPIPYGLLFFRYLNPERISMPE